MRGRNARPAKLKYMKKKALIGVVIAAAAVVCGFGGYKVYQGRLEREAYNKQVADSISAIPDIVITEGDTLPASDSVLSDVAHIDTDTINTDISSVDAKTPGTYTATYKFKDDRGVEHEASVPVDVKPELESHVKGLGDIEIDYGDDIPTEPKCTYDEYVSSVTMDTSDVDNMQPGTYEVTYTIVGVDGDMAQETHYCTVNDTRPSPTPTPTPKPTPTPTPEVKETEAPTEAETETEGPVSGNIQNETDTPVPTGDTNNIVGIIAIIAMAGIVAGLVVVRVKKKNRK